MTKERQCLEAIKVLWQKNFLAAGDGNFSFKDEDGELKITPSGTRKVDLKEGDFVFLKDSLKASSESLMHRTVFEACPKAQVVFHAHPTTAIALSLVLKENSLPENLLSELILSTGSIPIVHYARPGSQDMGENLKPYLPDCKVMILKHHGALTWGESVDEALRGMERLEHTCEIIWKALSLNQPLQSLSETEVEWLKEKRKSLGDKVL